MKSATRNGGINEISQFKDYIFENFAHDPKLYFKCTLYYVSTKTTKPNIQR